MFSAESAAELSPPPSPAPGIAASIDSDKVESLSAELQRFVNSGEYEQFMPPRQLRHEIAKRDVQSLEELLSDLLAVAREMGYDPSRDMGLIPLNTESTR
ncbi:MAG: hypothetical protein AAGL66_16945, partial [Pseudomonadota bacterium]